MFITKSKHEALMAEKDETIAGLMRRLETAKIMMVQSAKETGALSAKLAPFERARGKGGRFVRKGVE